MRYIEQQDDLESVVDAGETSHVGAISNMQVEDSQERQNTETDMELDHILDEWDDYKILAVAKKNTPRFTIDAIFGKNTINFMVDTGSPVSFVDEESANWLVKHAKARRSALSSDEQDERYSDFNGDTVMCKGKLSVDMKYGEWTTKEAKLYILGNKQSRCKLLGADVMAHGININPEAGGTDSSGDAGRTCRSVE